MNFKTTTVEEAYDLRGLKRPVIAIPNLPESYTQHLQEQLDLEIVIEAINMECNDGKPWEPNYHDGKHWEPLWFWIEADEENPAGSGFSITDTDCDYSYSGVGSRLCFKTEDGLKYALSQFKELYAKVILKLKK